MLFARFLGIRVKTPGKTKTPKESRPVPPCGAKNLRENHKNQKKHKIQTHAPRAGTWVWIFCCFCFLGFSRKFFAPHGGTGLDFLFFFGFPRVFTLIKKSPGKQHAPIWLLTVCYMENLLDFWISRRFARRGLENLLDFLDFFIFLIVVAPVVWRIFWILICWACCLPGGFFGLRWKPLGKPKNQKIQTCAPVWCKKPSGKPKKQKSQITAPDKATYSPTRWLFLHRESGEKARSEKRRKGVEGIDDENRRIC